MQEDILNLVNKVYKKEKITYDQFIFLIQNGYEMQFYYKNRKFGSTQFNDFEFYEWNKDEGYQSYKTIEELDNKINIDGKFLKDLWNDVSNVDFAD